MLKRIRLHVGANGFQEEIFQSYFECFWTKLFRRETDILVFLTYNVSCTMYMLEKIIGQSVMLFKQISRGSILRKF